MTPQSLFIAALVGTACTAPEREPSLLVGRLAPNGVCQICKVEASGEASDLPCGLTKADLFAAIGHEGCTEMECTFEAGRDEVLLVAVPGTVDSFDGYLSAARSVSLTTVLNGEQSVTASAAGFASAEADDDGRCSFVYSAPQGQLAADAEGTIRWVVADDGDDLDLYTKTYDVTPPIVCTEITASSDPVIAGVTRVTAVAEVPPNYPVERLQIAQFVNGLEVQVALFTASEAVDTDDGRRLTKSFIAPAQPFAKYEVEFRGLGDIKVGTATADESQLICDSSSEGTTGAEFKLTQPQPLKLALVAKGTAAETIDFGQSPVKRIAAESDDDCRSLELGIRAEALPKSSVLTIAADIGSLDNVGVMTSKPLPESGILALRYRMPATPTDAREVHFSALFGTAARGDLTLTFEKVHAANWKPLSTTSPTVQVGPTGSPPISLKGRLIAPTGTQFLAETRVDIRVEADPIGEPVKCTPALPASVIGCDSSEQGGGGGCVLADTSAAVAADGSFTIDLSSGACFTGQVTIEAVGMAYHPDQLEVVCIGERTAEKRDTGKIVLDFVDPP